MRKSRMRLLSTQNSCFLLTLGAIALCLFVRKNKSSETCCTKIPINNPACSYKIKNPLAEHRWHGRANRQQYIWVPKQRNPQHPADVLPDNTLFGLFA